MATNEIEPLVLESDEEEEEKENEHLINSRGNSRPSHRASVTFDEAVFRTGYGRFHYKLFVLCGWSLLTVTMATFGSTFILPYATCQMTLREYQITWLKAVVYIGLLVGALPFCTASDTWGRRRFTQLGLFFVTVSILASSFALTFWQLMLFRFFIGVGAGGCLPVLCTYYSEFQPAHRRGRMVCFLLSVWMVGSVLATVLAWLVLPITLKAHVGGLTYTGYNLYQSLCAILCLSSFICVFFLPESPKFLLKVGKDDESYDVLQKMFRMNYPLLYHFPVNRLDWGADNTDMSRWRRPDFPKLHDHCCLHVCTCWLFELLRLFAALFTFPQLSSTVVMTIVLLTVSFGYNGMVNWLSTRLALLDSAVGYTGFMCQPGNFTLVEDKDRVCQPGSSFFHDGLVAAVSSLPGNIISILFVDMAGRKALTATGFILTGLAGFGVWFMSGHFPSLVVSAVLSALYVIGCNCFIVTVLECTPTLLRCTRMGFVLMLAGIGTVCGQIAFDQLIHLSCILPTFLSAVCLVGGGLVCCFLPTKQLPPMLDRVSPPVGIPRAEISEYFDADPASIQRSGSENNSDMDFV